MIEYVGNDGIVRGLNPSHIVRYVARPLQVVVWLSDGSKLMLDASEEEWQLAIRDTTKTVCLGDHESPKRPAKGLLRQACAR